MAQVEKSAEKSAGIGVQVGAGVGSAIGSGNRKRCVGLRAAVASRGCIASGLRSGLRSGIKSGIAFSIALGVAPAFAQQGPGLPCSASTTGVVPGESTTNATDTSCGLDAIANGTGGSGSGDASAYGANASASGAGTTAVGANAMAGSGSSPSYGNTAIGVGAQANPPSENGWGNATAVGAGAIASQFSATAVGAGTQATQQFATALGNSSIASGWGSLAAGGGVASNWTSTALGLNTNASGAGDIALGANATTAVSTGGQTGGQTSGNIAIGTSWQNASWPPTGTTGAWADGGNAVAIGTSTQATGVSTVAIGDQASASGNSSVAFGNVAVSSGNNSVALGAGSTDGGQANVVSVGSAAQTRTVTNVTAGVSATDAVNVSQLPATLAGNAVTMGNPTAATGAGGQGSPVTVTNVAPGALTATSTDAVNGAQLLATNLNVASATNTANAALTTANNALSSASVARTTANTALGLAQSSVQYDDASHTGVTLDPGSAAASLHNVAAGTLSATSTDAVNGSQLYATNQSIASISGGVTNLTAGITNGTIGLVQQPGGTSAPIVVGAQTGGTVVNVTGTAGTRTVTGVTAGALSSTSTDAVNGSQLNATNQNVTAAQNIASTALSSAVAAQGTANRALGLAQNSVQYDDPAHSGVTFNPGGSAAGVHNVAAGALSATSTDAVNGSQLYATDQSINTRVANLTTQIANGAVGLVQQAGAATQSGQSGQAGTSGAITVGAQTGGTDLNVAGTSGDRRLSGVASGVASDDAVNIGQLGQAMQQTGTTAVGQANAYTDRQIGAVREQLNALGAEAMAAASLIPDARAKGNFQLAAAAGTYKGAAALAIGANWWPSERILVNAKVTHSTGDGGGLGAGVGVTVGF